MSIFRRDPDEPRSAAAGPVTHSAPTPTPERRPQPTAAGSVISTTHIAPGAKITGQVNGTSDLVVDGELEGQVRLESSVTIGTEGRVQGDIVAKSVRIGGRVVGNVQGLEKVEILPTGRLEGDVAAPRVVLAEGAFFKGKVEMTGKGDPGKAGVKKKEEGA
jgi:cytoskeletal protein CcmA (bactofilin family)